MRLEFLFPEHIEKAKKELWPLIIPGGTIEYHGPHCSFGCDTLIVTGLLRELEKEKNIITAPPIWYGPASYAVGGPEKGTVHVNVDNFEKHVYDILKALLYGGWRNIYVLIHHQYEQETLLPMTLSYMKAAKMLTFEYLEDSIGRGWWGDNKNAEFYNKLNEKENPWKWITVLPTMSKEIQERTGYDHAGKWECSILKALYPEAVDINKIKNGKEWFIQDAVDCSIEIGRMMVKLCIEDLKNKII